MNYKIIYKDYDFYRSPFSISWEQCKLSQLGRIETGNTPSTAIEEYYSDTGLLWVTPTDIISNILVNTDKKLSTKGISVARVIPANSILCTCIASIGKNAFLPVKCAFNQQINALTPFDNNYPYFLFTDSYHWSQTMKKGAGGLTFQIVNKTDFSNIKTNIPKYEEQKLIGKMFYVIDNLITLHQRKQKWKFHQKSHKNYAKKLTISWEQCKLGDIGSTFTGLSGKTSSDFGHGDAFFITYMNVFTNPIADPNRVEPIEIDNCQRQVQYGDVFFTTSSETPDEVGMSSIWLENKANVYLNSFCFGYRLNINIDPYYFAYLLRSDVIRKPMRLLAQGISRFNISKNKVMEISASLPNLVEQRKIGTIMYKLDNLITLHQCKDFYDFNKYVRKNTPLKSHKITTTWEQCKLSDVVQITMGQSPDGSTYSDTPSDYILVQGNADLENGWVKPRMWTTQKTKICNAGDLIMSVRAPAGNMGKTLYNAVIGRGVAAIKGNEFIYQTLVKMDNDGYWKTLSCGSTFESLNSDNIKNAEISVPQNTEQIKIGNIFENLDNLITLHLRL